MWNLISKMIGNVILHLFDYCVEMVLQIQLSFIFFCCGWREENWVVNVNDWGHYCRAAYLELEYHFCCCVCWVEQKISSWRGLKAFLVTKTIVFCIEVSKCFFPPVLFLLSFFGFASNTVLLVYSSLNFFGRFGEPHLYRWSVICYATPRHLNG